MSRTRDFVTHGTHDQLSASLREKIGHLELLATEVWGRREMGDASRVFPGLLRSTARQLHILDASTNLPIEVAAGACRTTFEVNVRARLAVADPAYVMKLQLEFVGDEQSLLTAFLKLSDGEGAIGARSVIDERLDQIQRVLDRRGLKSARASQVRANAETAGVLSEYETLYRFYSKYVHGSGWLILASDENRDGEEYRNILQVMTQIYAGDTFQRISTAVES